MYTSTKNNNIVIVIASFMFLKQLRLADISMVDGLVERLTGATELNASNSVDRNYMTGKYEPRRLVHQTVMQRRLKRERTCV